MVKNLFLYSNLFTLDIMTEQNTTAKTDGSITTYCIEHAKTQQSKCAACEKTIPHKSLRVAEIFRKSKKVKKDLAKHTWYHFKCFKGKYQHTAVIRAHADLIVSTL